MANKKKTIEKPESQISEEERSQKIQSLHDMIASAEKTIQSTKAMLLHLEGKKKSGRRRKIETEAGDNVVTGTFDGQIMIGTDGKQYPVPANYASKSKLVEGDMLKLTITLDGSFIYKQIGPTERKHALGIASQDERGNYYIIADGKPYRILLASITYFKVEPGDEVAIVIPRDIETSWAAVENVIQKGRDKKLDFQDTRESGKITKNGEDKEKEKSASNLIDEWTADIEEIEKEVKKEEISNQ